LSSFFLFFNDFTGFARASNIKGSGDGTRSIISSDDSGGGEGETYRKNQNKIFVFSYLSFF
jgi:hypothetical protein